MKPVNLGQKPLFLEENWWFACFFAQKKPTKWGLVGLTSQNQAYLCQNWSDFHKVGFFLKLNEISMILMTIIQDYEWNMGKLLGLKAISASSLNGTHCGL